MKVKDINKIFRFFTIKYWKDYIRLKHILKCIKNAKERFIKDRSKPCNVFLGLCYYLGTELFGYNNFIYNDIKNVIPIFTPEYFHVSGSKRYGYWWDIYDVYSRIDAFDKLINHYKNLIKEL